MMLKAPFDLSPVSPADRLYIWHTFTVRDFDTNQLLCVETYRLDSKATAYRADEVAHKWHRINKAPVSVTCSPLNRQEQGR